MELFLVCFSGAILGTIAGLLPGLAPSTMAALIFPLITSMNIEYGVILLTSILYGSQYSSSTSAILFNVPGENSSVLTAIDGHKLAMQGKAKLALLVSAFSSFIGAIVSLLVIILCIDVASSLVTKMTSFHYFWILLLGWLLLLLSDQKNIYAYLIGAVIAMIGNVNGVERFTFGLSELYDGIDPITLTVCLFGLSSIAYEYLSDKNYEYHTYTSENIPVNMKELESIIPASIRGSFIGLLGILPMFHSLVSIIAYNIEKVISKNKDLVGEGSITAVAAVESSNNSSSQASIIPVLSIGVPTGPITGFMVTLLSINGIVVGPNVITHLPHLFTAIILVNIILVVLNYSFNSIWVKLLTINRHIINAIILVISLFGLSQPIWVAIPLVIIGVYIRYKGQNVGCVFVGFVIAKLLEEYGIRVFTIGF